MKHKYSVHLVWSDDDKAFIAQVPELPGCMSDGATPGEALKNLDVIIDEWIETAKELKRKIPKPLNLQMIEEMIGQFDKWLKQQVSREVETAVKRVLEDLANARGSQQMLVWGSHALVKSSTDPAEWWKYGESPESRVIKRD